MSLDRYIAVCKPFSTTWQKFQTQNMAFVVSIILCIFAMVADCAGNVVHFQNGTRTKLHLCVSNLLKPF